ncbi:MAG: DUF6456 domain-containing protein [Rhizobiaceae bacterium]
MNGVDQRSTLRVLALLARNRNGLAVEERDGSRLELAGEDSVSLVRADVVRDCVRRELASTNAGRLRLTQAGRAHLARERDTANGFRSQHGEQVVVRIVDDGQQVELSANAAESPLSRLYRRRERNGRPWLDENQFRSGERLRTDFERGQLQPRISANWQIAVAGRSRDASKAADMPDFVLDSRRKVEKAIECLDPEMAGVALDICCFLKGLEQVEMERQWPPRSAKLMLKTALSILARHYGFLPGVPRNIAMLHWGDENYRPAFRG